MTRRVIIVRDGIEFPIEVEFRDPRLPPESLDDIRMALAIDITAAWFSTGAVCELTDDEKDNLELIIEKELERE